MKLFINVFSRICKDCHIQYGVNKERFGFHKSENGAESSDVMPLYCWWTKRICWSYQYFNIQRQKKQSGSFCTCDSSPPVHVWSCKSERCHCDYQWSETIVANSIQHSKHRNSTKFAVYLLPADDPSPSLEIARTCWLTNRRVALVQPPHRDTWIQVLC